MAAIVEDLAAAPAAGSRLDLNNLAAQLNARNAYYKFGIERLFCLLICQSVCLTLYKLNYRVATMYKL